MLSNKRFLKISSYVGLLSIISSNLAVAIPTKVGELYIHARKELKMVGAPSLRPVVEDISRVSYEDFDVTENCPPLMRQFGDYVWDVEKQEISKLHLDTNIPYINGSNPRVDYMSLRSIPSYISKLENKVHPSVLTGSKAFFEKVIVPNQQKLNADKKEIPDLDCLYYKDVGGVQHLFLRLSSETRKRAEIFNKESNGKTIYVEKGKAKLLSDGDIKLDHVNIEADNIEVEAKNTLLNKAAKMKAKWVIRLKAGKQKNETVINKWVREEKGKRYFVHKEGAESVDDCVFVAKEVIQEGADVENIGIYVESDKFDDRATHTSNMPAKITLYNYAWVKKKRVLSSAESSVDQIDDVLVPTRYHVNYYRSASDEKNSSVKFGYTLIHAGSKIEVIKDIKEDVPVDEEHTIEIHEEKSGFSFCGGAKVPDPTELLKKINKASHSGNMVGLTTSTISAVAKGIQVYEDVNVIKDLAMQQGAWTGAQTMELMQTLAHFVNGPSIQLGSRSLDMQQKQTKTHGNTMFAPKQFYINSIRSTFGGTYRAKEMKIKTGTLVTFELPQTFERKLNIHQSGISMDLLTFALLCVAPYFGAELAVASGVASGAAANATLLDMALGATSVNVSCSGNQGHQVYNKPTEIQADKLEIEADNGQLTQAQIKAGLVHAIFTNDLVVETLSNINWTKQSGGGFSVSLGGLANFKDLATSLKETAKRAVPSNIDSGSFEKKIDDFAFLVGEEDFYLKVGNVLKSKSAFIGHIIHDKDKEHIEAKKRINEEVDQKKYSWDNSFDLPVADVFKVTDTISKIKQSIFDDAIKEGVSPEKAKEMSEEKSKEIKEQIETEQSNIEKTVEKIVEIDEKIKSKEKASNNEKADALVVRLKYLAQESAKIESQKGKNEVEQASLQTQLDVINEARQEYLLELDQLEAAEKVQRANEAVLKEKDRIKAWADPWLADEINETSIRKGAENIVAREYKLKKDLINALYDTNEDYVNGKGIATKPQLENVWIDHETSMDYIVSVEELNKPENRWNRLYQKNLSKIGESDEQKAIKELPIFGMLTKPCMEWKYGRIDGFNAVGDVILDTTTEIATNVVGGAVLNKAGKLAKPVIKAGAAKFSKLIYKSASKNRFARNLLARYFENAGQSHREAAIFGRVETVKIGNEKFDSFVRDSSVNMNTSLRHKTFLAFEEAGMITHEGKLTEQATKIKGIDEKFINIKGEEEEASTRMIMSIDKLNNNEAKDAMLKLNPNGKWGKYVTKSIKVLDGQSAEIHFYMEEKTKQIYLGHDFKIKVDGNNGVAFFTPGKNKGKK